MQISEGDLLIYLIAAGFAILVSGIILFGYLGIRKNNSKLAYDEQLQDLLEDENDPDFKPNIPLSEKWNNYWNSIARESGIMRYSGEHNNAGRDITFVAIISAVLISVVTRNLIAGVVISVALVFLIGMLMKTLANRKSDAINGQLPGFLFALKANVQANETPERAILRVIDGMPAPLYDDIVLVKHRLMANSTFKEALQELSIKTSSRDLKFLCACMIQASGAGANLEAQIDTLQKVLENRQKVSDELTKAIRGAAPSIWVASLAIPVMFVATYIISEGAREFWFVDPLSWVALVGVGVLWAVGLLLTKRLVDNIKKL